MTSSFERECAENLMELVGRKVVDVRFKVYDDECWRIYIITDSGKMVMTFCRDWKCPVVEKRNK
ncbi:hypothetical protein U2150_07590 [Methanothermobacter wolfeii]|uniref:PepSY domain-containing protein n=1 Tax=Methanothermobacter wolfeii TaxID=145261 RepID=A0A9E7RVE1_METWO|nr:MULTISPECIES: hypothetical protein [Methanothermobacter]MDI6703017.1 hypothetical protein [Methanothermobacter wolfeii]MDI6842685.1 hypothetical protein [Methanothermobacter wolfeii]NLM02642.1 hypothetical protein [Methanothermobacter wolfeii]QHN05852.1 hypothetical protein FZP57_01330 [Methanothermobacter sp. THM-1]UXH32008.1 PepSY domain-containing protein [Methanothermobacter wolfeii]